jgi:hypothetical protein
LTKVLALPEDEEIKVRNIVIEANIPVGHPVQSTRFVNLVIVFACGLRNRLRRKQEHEKGEESHGNSLIVFVGGSGDRYANRYA